MQEMQAQLEKLRVDAEDCALISKLATDRNKREWFARPADHLRALTSEVEKAIKAALDEQPDDLVQKGNDKT